MDDIESLIKSGLITVPPETVIYETSLMNNSDTIKNVRVVNGWDVISAYNCDKTWSTYRFRLAEFIYEQYSEAERQDILKTIQVEDGHWKWLDKAIFLKSPEYQWYFIKTDDDIEGACLTYHPKDSFLSKEKIFYIEFIAVAPWNRKNPMEKKRYNNIGSLLLRAVTNYSVNNLGLTYQFGLHSLPQAVGFYKKIGMVHCQEADKDQLCYFEIDKQHSINFVGSL